MSLFPVLLCGNDESSNGSGLEIGASKKIRDLSIMTKRVFTTDVIFRNIVVVFFAALALVGSCENIWCQSPTPTPDSKESRKETKVETEKSNQPAQAQSGIKVVFDETAPGILIIESNGERVRVDTTKKTVEPLAAVASQEKTAETLQPKEVTETEISTTKKEESVFDFDEGEEPYDSRLINIPTPKKVPRGTWNLWFSHRFSQPIHPIEDSARNLFGFDSFSVSSFGVTYGITDKFYVTAARSPLCERGLCRTIEIGFGYNWLAQDKDSPIGLTTYASIEGNGNFTEEYTYNLQTMLSARVNKRIYLFFSPALSINSNGQGRFNPRAGDFFPPATAAANAFRLPTNTGSFGFGASVLIMPDLVALFDFTPRVGFKLGRVQPIFDNNFNVTGFQNLSEPSMGFGIQKNIGKHAFSLTFSNTQTTTTSRYNSSNLVLKPRRLILGFNLSRRF